MTRSEHRDKSNFIKGQIVDLDHEKNKLKNELQRLDDELAKAIVGDLTPNEKRLVLEYLESGLHTCSDVDCELHFSRVLVQTRNNLWYSGETNMPNDDELVTNITPAALLGLLQRENEPAPAVDPEYEEAGLPPEVSEQRRLSRKPRIDHLKAGTIKDDELGIVPMFDVNDRIVAERRASLLPGNPWLDTEIYIVQSIDDEAGVVKCYHEDLRRVSFIGFKDEFTTIKLAPARGNPFKADNIAREEKKEAKKAALPPGEKIRRGRPKGSKNRSKEEVNAERQAKKAERDAKKAKRKGMR